MPMYPLDTLMLLAVTGWLLSFNEKRLISAAAIARWPLVRFRRAMLADRM